jgi:hypothetical protein
MLICLYIPLIVFVVVALVRNTLIQNCCCGMNRLFYFYTRGVEDLSEVENEKEGMDPENEALMGGAGGDDAAPEPPKISSRGW